MKKLILFLLMIFLTAAFLTDSPPTAGGWYQQFMPDLGGRTIQDITFLDSLTGYAVTNSNGQYDTAYILKTINGGDNWSINYSRTAWFTGFNKVKFINQNTGFVCGVSVSGGPKGLTRTTNGGINWFDLNIPDPYLNYLDMSVLNENTVWLVNDDSFSGGVYFTSNGGVNWQNQINLGSYNPDHIYMYNERIGFIAENVFPPDNNRFLKTTNGGINWVNITSDGFYDMHFVDSLIGWKCSPSFDGDSSVKKTTNGGLNWIKQRLPQGGMINLSQVSKFSVLNRDTLWGCGGSLFYGSGRYRGILYRTTNGGNNWLFQVPDTSFQIQGYGNIQFLNGRTGWAYSTQSGIHTTTGGNDTFYTGLQQISTKIPEQFRLYQNYPNPFNPRTVISYKLRITGYVTLSVYNIQGKHVIDLVSQKQNAGTYEVDFSKNGLSSGVYFYKMTVTDEKSGIVYTDTKKMILIK